MTILYPDAAKSKSRTRLFGLGLGRPVRDREPAGPSEADREWAIRAFNAPWSGTTAGEDADRRIQLTMTPAEYRALRAASRRFSAFDRMADEAAELSAAMDRHESGLLP